jgi:hypothetical protein
MAGTLDQAESIEPVGSRSSWRLMRYPPLRPVLLGLPVLVVVAVFDANVALALAAVVALVAAGRQVAVSDATARQTLTYNYAARWESAEFLSLRHTAAEFWDLGDEDADARWEQWQAWVREKNNTDVLKAVTAVLHFWENVAGAYNRGLLDEDVFRTDLANLMLGNWKRVSWYIRKARERDAFHFAEWKTACDQLREGLEATYAEGARRAERALALGYDLLEI